MSQYVNHSFPTISIKEVDNRVESIPASAPTKEELKLALSLVDLTSLEGKDTDASIRALCEKAKKYNTAAVCVYPSLVRIAKKELANTKLKVASVAGAFPSGQSSLRIKLAEIQFALDEGADEIDMVISRGKFLEKKFQEVFDEIAAIKDLCKKNTLKVILETGELETLDNVRMASNIAMQAGADFIKTSTGKVSVNATLPVTLVMLDSIKEFQTLSGKKIGMKPAGGISDGVTAALYLRLVENIVGKDWLNPNLFRFGASRLVDNIIAELEGKVITNSKDY